MPPDMNLSDVPPPPYSERDVYSHQDHRRPDDNNGRPPSSIAPSSSSNNVIHTPFPTPSTDVTITTSNNNGFGPLTSDSSPARAYFESRPLPPGFYQELHITHTISVSAASCPDQFPYSPEFAAHDVTPQDWQTFLNFLLPHHATASNEAIIDRKLAAEEQSQAAVHLERLRRESAEVHAQTPSTTVKQEAEAVAAEWNRGFFQPRAIWVRLVFPPPPEGRHGQNPNIRDSDQLPIQQHRPPGPSALVMPPPFHPPMIFHTQPYYGPWHQKQPESSFSFAGIKIGDDGFSIGNTVVADRNGIRVGGLIADADGLRYRDNVIAGRGMFGGGPNPGYPGTTYHQSAFPVPYHRSALVAPGSLPRGAALPAARFPADSHPAPYFDTQSRPPGVGMGGGFLHPPHGPNVHVSRLPGFPHGQWGGRSVPTTSFGVVPSHGAEGNRPEQRHFPLSGGWPAEGRQGGERTRAGGQAGLVRPCSPAQGEAISYPQSQVKFRLLDELEKELARKYTQLDEARAWDEAPEIKTEGERLPETVDALEAGKGVDDGRSATEIANSAVMLEAEVEELKRSIDRLRIEADEEFARELEEQERRETGGSRSGIRH